MLNDKKSEEVLIEKAVKTIIEILFDKGLSDNYDNAGEILKKFLHFDEINERRRPDLVKLNDKNNVIH